MLNPQQQEELIRLSTIADKIFSGHPLSAHGPLRKASSFNQSQEFNDYRNYQPGDDVRLVDWRVSSRLDHPVIRRYDDVATTHWYLCIDTSSSMAFGDGRKWAATKILALTLSYLLLHRGLSTAIIAFDSRARLVTSKLHGLHNFFILNKEVDQLHPETTQETSQLKSVLDFIPRHSSIMVISDFISPDCMQTDLLQCAHWATQVHAIRIASQQDHNLETFGLVNAVDVETLQQQTLDINSQTIDKAAANLSVLETELSEFCLAHHIVFSTADVEADWKDNLINHLNRIRVNRD